MCGWSFFPFCVIGVCAIGVCVLGVCVLGGGVLGGGVLGRGGAWVCVIGGRGVLKVVVCDWGE